MAYRYTPRTAFKRASNNPENDNKNICVLAVARALAKSDERAIYLHTMNDLLRAAKKQGFRIRSRRSELQEIATVGAARKVIKKLAKKEEKKFIFHRKKALAYIVGVHDHVLLLDPDGKTIVDTAPRKVDRRKVEEFYVVFYEQEAARAELSERWARVHNPEILTIKNI